MYKTARNSSLSWIKMIQSTSFYPSAKSFLILYSRPRLGLLYGFLRSGSPHQVPCVHFSTPLRATHPAHPMRPFMLYRINQFNPARLSQRWGADDSVCWGVTLCFSVLRSRRFERTKYFNLDAQRAQEESPKKYSRNPKCSGGSWGLLFVVLRLGKA